MTYDEGWLADIRICPKKILVSSLGGGGRGHGQAGVGVSGGEGRPGGAEEGAQQQRGAAQGDTQHAEADDEAGGKKGAIRKAYFHNAVEKGKFVKLVGNCN